MGKVLYSATMSLDGFIAGAGGDMSWLTEQLGPNPAVDDVIGQIGALLVCIAPVLLGDGVRLFDHPGGTNVKLERVSLSQAPKATNLWLRVVHPSYS
jgi:hypothetical protein